MLECHIVQTKVFLHGFLGSPRDWENYTPFFYPCLTPDMTQIDTLEAFGKSLPEGSHLVGYSMGGRIALWLLSLFPRKFSSAVLLSANPGIENREERILEDEKWIDILKNEPLADFIDKWYKQPLFRNSPIPSWRLDQDPEKLIVLIQKFSVAKQPSFWNDLHKFQVPMLFLFGQEDEKYQRIAACLKSKNVQVETIQGATHAIHLEKGEECISKISSFIRAMELQRSQSIVPTY